mgnify:CR=1 FL=1
MSYRGRRVVAHIGRAQRLVELYPRVAARVVQLAGDGASLLTLASALHDGLERIDAAGIPAPEDVDEQRALLTAHVLRTLNRTARTARRDGLPLLETQTEREAAEAERADRLAGNKTRRRGAVRR